jgi:hypothetical protein
MKKKMTQHDRLRAYMTATMHQVMKELGYAQHTYEIFQHDMGLAYLDAYLRGDSRSIWLVRTHMKYWGWWRANWYTREQEFLQTLGDMPLQVARWQWKKLHNPYELAKGLTPNGQMLEDSYCRDLVPKLK